MAKELRIRDEQGNLLYPVTVTDLVFDDSTGKTAKEQLAEKQDTISDLSTIRSGASAGATAYQKPSGGIPKTDLASAVQTSLGKADTALQTHQDISGKQDVLVSGTNIKTVNNTSLLGSGNISIPKGDPGEDGTDGEDAYQPFKGWFDSSSALSAAYPSPQVGDFAYVKGATSTDPVAIYACATAGTWADSGSEFNPANNQEFGSGEALNVTNIVDSLTSTNAHDILSAKQGNVLDQKVAALGLDLGEVTDVIKPQDTNNVFYIIDGNGNVIAQIDYEGLKTIALFVKNGEGELQNILDLIPEPSSSDIADILSDYYTASLKVSDKFGNVIFNIDQDGVEYISKMGSSHFLYKKKLVTICDSLGAASQWQTRLAKITGAIYDKTKNDNRHSFGGTTTISSSQVCGQDRAKLIVSDEIDPDVIIIENVNDSAYMSNVGSDEDVAFFKASQSLLDVTSQASSSDAETFWTNNFSTIVGGLTPTIGKVVGIPFTQSNAVKLTITGAATASGEFGITLSGTGVGKQSISVSAGESVSSIISKIYEYAWNNFVCTYSNNVVTFTPTSSSATPTITIDAGGTGITSTTATGQTGSNAVWKYFNSHDASDWDDPTKWVDNISLWAAWKGLVEYLQGQFPNAYIYWFIPKTYNFDYTSSSYKRADGTIDYDKVLSEKDYAKSLFTAQLAFCEYYQIPVIDIRNESCITPANIAEYCNVNNVHPKQAAYDRWADVIAKIM